MSVTLNNPGIQLATAYREMEPHIHDCVLMARIITTSLDRDDEEFGFAVHLLADMIEKLEKRYRGNDFSVDQ